VIGDKLFIFGGMVHIAADNDIYVNHIFELERGQWVHAGRYLEESKGFSQIVKLDPETLGIIGGQSYFPIKNAAILTVELFGLANKLQDNNSTVCEGGDGRNERRIVFLIRILKGALFSKAAQCKIQSFLEKGRINRNSS
jgi:hypothetical protein